MLHIQIFRELFLKESVNEVITLLRDLPKEDKKEIIRETRKIRNAKGDWEHPAFRYEKESDQYRGYITSIQGNILAFCNFFCLGKDDLAHIEHTWRDLPEFEEMEKQLEIHIPEDFPGLYAQVLINRPNNVTYDNIMPWIRKGYVEKDTLAPFLAAHLAELFPRYTDTDDPVKFITGRLAEYPEILNEQVWFLFEYPHEVSYTDKLNKTKVNGKTGPWTYVFRTYSQNGQLDRMRLFRECIAATDRPFRKDQLHWYVDLFEGMQPTNAELIELQDELFTSLSGVLSRKVNMTLGMIKQIAAEKDFRKEDFLQLVPMLLASEVKATLTGTLGILELLAKTQEELRHSITQLTTSAFLSKDETVQTRAARLIARYGNPDSDEQKITLQNYSDCILMSVRPLLSDYPEGNPQTSAPSLSIAHENKAQTIPISPIRDDNRISLVTDIEDLIFRLGNALSNFTPADFYLVPEALVRLSDQITEEIMDQMAPLIQSAYKKVDRWDPSRPHHLDLMAYFFLDYCKHFFERFPQGDKKFQKTRNRSLENIRCAGQVREYADKNSVQPAFQGYRRLMDECLEKVRANDPHPLLYTPTHTPCWIDPKVLTDRLSQYQEAGCQPSTADMQQALQLCWLQHPEKALHYIQKELTGEFRELLTWLLDPEAPLPADRSHADWWLTAGITQYKRELPEELCVGIAQIPVTHLKGTFIATPYIDEYVSHVSHNSETGQDEPVVVHNPKIRIDIRELYSKDTDGTNLYAGLSFSWTDRRLANINSFMLSMPNNWQTHLALLIDRVLQFSSDAIDKYVIPIPEIYRQVQSPLRGLDYTILAYCMISADKTLRTYAGETWAELTEKDLLDNRTLGYTLGTFEKIEYAPLKRFNELIEKNMMGLDSQHNQALEQLLNACISQLPETPVANLKKLLELYKEVLSRNNSRISQATLPHQEAWRNEASLKKVMKQLSDKLN